MKIVLATLHARYIHASLALPYLAAFCRDIPDVEIVIREFTTKEELCKVRDEILFYSPDLVAFSCYIWNIDETLSVAKSLKEESNSLIVLGGPEVSYGGKDIIEKNPFIDFIIKGEGENGFHSLIKNLISPNDELISATSGIIFRSNNKIIDTGQAEELADLDSIPSPFTSNLVDCSKRLVYYETSRGCAYSCAFCLSALDQKVRSFSMNRIKDDISYLINQKVEWVKFVDRTFNYNLVRANDIWSYILEKNVKSRFHFEIAADLLTDENMKLLKKVPPDRFRFEIGVQSTSAETLDRISRKSNLEKVFKNVSSLIEETNIDIHLDLIAGLPGEGYKRFLKSLDDLFEIGPHHLQAEPLKILKGTPMVDIAKKEGFGYDKSPPYAAIETPWMSEYEFTCAGRIGWLLEKIYNSGHFQQTIDFLRKSGLLTGLFDGLSKDEISHQSGADTIFEAIWLFGNENFSNDLLSLFADALSFDMAMMDYPPHKSLPDFIGYNGKTFSYPPKAEVLAAREQMKLDSAVRLRILEGRFIKNYLDDRKSGATLRFYYIGRKGLKQEVRVEEFGLP